jgi:hypothetical protein
LLIANNFLLATRSSLSKGTPKNKISKSIQKQERSQQTNELLVLAAFFTIIAFGKDTSSDRLQLLTLVFWLL